MSFPSHIMLFSWKLMVWDRDEVSLNNMCPCELFAFLLKVLQEWIIILLCKGILVVSTMLNLGMPKTCGKRLVISSFKFSSPEFFSRILLSLLLISTICLMICQNHWSAVRRLPLVWILIFLLDVAIIYTLILY